MQEAEGAAACARTAPVRSGRARAADENLDRRTLETDAAPGLRVLGMPRLQWPVDTLEDDSLAGRVLDEEHLPLGPEVAREVAARGVEDEPHVAQRRHQRAIDAGSPADHVVRDVVADEPAAGQIVEEPVGSREARQKNGRRHQNPRSRSHGGRHRLQYASVLRAAVRTFSAFGRIARSRMRLKPTGVNVEPTRSTGASRYSKSSDAMRATSSPPNPPCTLSSWTTRTRDVFFTEAAMASKSSGTSDRRSSTSTLFPSFASASAASSAKCTGVPYARIVRSVPSRRRRATPNGTANPEGTRALACVEL